MRTYRTFRPPSIAATGYHAEYRIAGIDRHHLAATGSGLARLRPPAFRRAIILYIIGLMNMRINALVPGVVEWRI